MPASRSWATLATGEGGECAKSEGQVEQRDASLYEALGFYRNPLYKDSTGSAGAGRVEVASLLRFETGGIGG
jgi:hypothetical protein